MQRTDRSRMGPSTVPLGPLLDACTWPSEAFWRAFELSMLADVQWQKPVLELGCGDGAFTSLAGLQVDEAIDLNERAVRRAQRRTDVYGVVRCADVRELASHHDARFHTVFANSVLEHVADLESVLSACAGVLRPGGSLIATVPLVDMNRNLVMSRRRYVRLRQRQLCHVNLWSVERWHEELRRAGFSDVEHVRYLAPASCRYWDTLDLVAGWGFGRYRVAPMTRKMLRAVTPPSARREAKRVLARTLAARMPQSPVARENGCAMLVVARTPHTNGADRWRLSTSA